MMLWCSTWGMRCSSLGMGLCGSPQGPNKILSFVLTCCDYRREMPWARRAIFLSVCESCCLV